MRGPDSDAIELTFRAPVRDGIYLPGSTHTTGRNRLYAEARDGGHEYLIFTDDDAAFVSMSQAEGCRRFEELVAEFHPVVASPLYPWHLTGHLERTARAQGLIATDICLNAIHRDAWPLLLPYWSKFDRESWWNAAHVFNRVCAVLWPGGAVQLNGAEIENRRHGDYPNKGKCMAADAMLLEMLRPGMKHLVWPHATPDSYRAVCPLLRNGYTMSKSEVGRYFDTDHEYWRGRF